MQKNGVQVIKRNTVVQDGSVIMGQYETREQLQQIASINVRTITTEPRF